MIATVEPKQNFLFELTDYEPQGSERTSAGESVYLGTLSSGQLSALVGVSDRYIRSLENQGVISKLDNGRYDAASTLQNLFRHYRTQNTTKADLNAKKAQLLQMDIDERMGNLITREEQDNWRAVILGFVARALEGIPINQTELFPELERDDAYSRLEKISNGIKDGLHKELIKLAENPPKRKNDSRKTKTDPTE